MDGSLTALDRAIARVQGAAAAAVLALPRPVVRALAGAPVGRDGLVVHPEAQLFLRLVELTGAAGLDELNPPAARRRMDRDTLSARGPLPALKSVSPISVPGPDGALAARLYDPFGGEPGGLLVYFHGGGFVVGGLDSHEATCRWLALGSGARVLAVDYRLAPEHRFPAAVEDAWAAWGYATGHAEQLGADPARLAVGGDSAGGNLAAGVAQRAAREGGRAPVLQLLFYPWLDLTVKRRSYELFGEGFYLSAADLDAYAGHYALRAADRADPRCSPLLADELAGVAPAYIATAGFDPLRDEGEEYAARLRAAGVRVALARHAGLFHGFANLTGAGHTGREAVAAAAGAVALALA